MSLKSNSKFLAHIHLENLINNKFGKFVDIRHEQFPELIWNARNKMIRARTTVWAYNSVQDAKDGNNYVAVASSECGINDHFVKRTGLTLALRRLYRELANKTK